MELPLGCANLLAPYVLGDEFANYGGLDND
jgi:hypothetical protein